MSTEYVRIKRVFGTSLDEAKKLIVIENTNETLSIGGWICDVKFPKEKVKKGCNFSVSKNFNNDEMEVHLDNELLSDERLKEIHFCFNNFDY